MTLSLSILIPSVTERLEHFSRTYGELSRQAGNLPVEVLAIVDNKRRTTGAKRNELVALSRGAYVVFVDDDDRVTEDYVRSLLDGVEARPDCVLFDVMVHISGQEPRICRYDPSYDHVNLPNEYRRRPNHVMCYARQIAIRHPYADISYGEDTEWATRASRDIRRVHRIPRVLYHYDVIEKSPSWYFPPGKTTTPASSPVMKSATALGLKERDT